MDTKKQDDRDGSESYSQVSYKKSRKRQSEKMDVNPQCDRPKYPPLKRVCLVGNEEMRKIPVPSHRYTPLKENWMEIYTPIVKHLHLQIRFNLKTRMVEIKTCEETQDISALQKACDFVQAFVMGFNVKDALAVVRLDELFFESFEITDVKPLHGDHLSRAIGRIVGKEGRTKHTIENSTKTRIVVADKKIHILGAYNNVRAARTVLCNLILGSEPSKVYGTMHHLSSRLSESL